MADITVDVNLPSSVSVDVTSPTQVLATNVSIPGPQGPRGEKGNPTSINNLTAENIIITGSDGNVAYTSGTSTIFISGNSGYFQSAVNSLTTNLNSTGANLNTSINNLSGLFTGYTGTLDATFASDIQLANTGTTLVNSINSLSGTLTGNYLTTNSASSTYATITNLNSTGNTLNSNISALSGTLTSNYATINNLALTGSNLNTKIDNFSGTYQNFVDNLDSTYATDVQLQNTGTSLNNSISSLSGTLTSNYATINNLNSTGSTLETSIASTGNTLNLSINSLSGTLTSTYATITNLASTGSTLNNSINSLSGTLTSTYATINNLASTGSTLTTNLANTGSNLDTKIDVLSGSAVLLYDNQTINGLKDFTTRPTVNTTPVLLSGESANGLTVLVRNDDSVTLNKGQPVYIYGANGNNILVRKAVNTGEATSSKTLGLLNQSLAPNAQGLVITEGALEGIDTNAGNAGDPIWLGPTGDLIFGLAQKPYAPNHLVYLGVIERKQSNNGKIYVKVQNGFELQELHNVNIDHKNALNNNDILRYNSASGLWFNETLNTGTFQTQINSLSGSSVLLYGDQSVGGVKTFRDNVYINNLFVTGAQTVVSTNNFSVQSPYVLLNLTGGAVDGGIFFVTGTGLTGANDTGPIIGFDHSTKFKFGFSTRNSDLSTLPDIASVQDIIAYSGFVDGKYATITNVALTGSTLSTNLALTGSTLQTNINNLSNTYATITNVALTGSTLDTKINNLSGYINSTGSNILFTTGNQTVNGNKSFTSSSVLTVKTISGFKGTSPDSLNLIATNDNTVVTNINLAGNINLTAGTGSTFGTSTYGNINLNAGGPKYEGQVNLFGNVSINNTNSNTLLNSRTIKIYKTGFYFGNPTTAEALTIDNNNISINTVAGGDPGFGLLISGVLVTPALYATSANLVSTGSTLNSSINSLSGYVNSTNSNIVFTTGDQSIGGDKIFTNKLNITSSATSDSALKVGTLELQPYSVNNAWFGDNTYYNGGFYRREAGYAGAFYFQGPEGQFRFAGTDDANTTYTPAVQLKTHLDGRFGVGSDISTATDDFTNSNFFVNSNGNVGINTLTPSEKLEVVGNIIGNNLVYNTGNQTISGVKTFIGNHNISGDTIISGNLNVSGMIRTPQQNKTFVYRPAATGGGNVSATIAYGSNCTLTPRYVGTLRADAAISMWGTNGSSLDTVQATSFWYGTGTAPVYSGNLVNLGGVRIGAYKALPSFGRSVNTQSDQPIGTSWVAEITGLNTGTQYWFDIGISGIRIRAQDIQLYIEEKY